MIEREPLHYGTEERLEYIAARLAYRRVPKYIIREVLDADTDFVKLILQKGDWVLFNNLGAFSLQYVPPRDECKLPPSAMFPDGFTIPASDEYNRVRFRPYKRIQKEFKDMTYGNAFHKPLEESEDEEIVEDEFDGEKAE